MNAYKKLIIKKTYNLLRKREKIVVREAHEKCLAHSVALVVLHNQSAPGKIYCHAPRGNLQGRVSIFCQEQTDGQSSCIYWLLITSICDYYFKKFRLPSFRFNNEDIK